MTVKRLNQWLMAQRDEIVASASFWIRNLSEGTLESRIRLVKETRYLDLLLSMDDDRQISKIAGLESLCTELVSQGVSFPFLLEVLHIWRDSVIEFAARAPEEQISRDDILILHRRIDFLHMAICRYYWGHAENVIRAMENKISELSDERISLIGKMASSMAHEIRNPLTAAGGFIKLIRMQLPRDTPERVGHYLEYIEEEFHHINMLITGFLSFSNNRIIEEPSVTVDLAELLESVLGLYGSRLKNEHIGVDTNRLQPMKLHVQKTSILQVFSNILNNSIDALSSVLRDKRIRFSSFENADWFGVTIANNGPEIPEHVKPDIFSPFATGKLDGSGLGLAMCKKIMVKNGGDITFASTKEETSFTLIFSKGTYSSDPPWQAGGECVNERGGSRPPSVMLYR